MTGGNELGSVGVDLRTGRDVLLGDVVEDGQIAVFREGLRQEGNVWVDELPNSLLKFVRIDVTSQDLASLAPLLSCCKRRSRLDRFLSESLRSRKSDWWVQRLFPLRIDGDRERRLLRLLSLLLGLLDCWGNTIRLAGSC
jgi:hypothetical protein